MAVLFKLSAISDPYSKTIKVSNAKANQTKKNKL